MADKISPDDLLAKFTELKEETDTGVDKARDTAVTVGALLLILLFVAAFVLGRRRGLKRTTVVEIRRI
ncbi:MAG: hypothetical protein GY745_01550 [Actinomycetia bacterium]|nr:hypothetical protein [Actinomycetes bacterium]MCP3910400.1 hypothetical protein [Actinomycetes bacterium]MCP4083734.1 hypothetical protein [Actinomycetes bacterium]